jgi:ribonuclease VapC
VKNSPTSVNGPVYVLDSFTVLCFLDDEPGADRVIEVLSGAQSQQATVYLSIINLGEILYITERERGFSLAQQTLNAVEELPIKLLNATRTSVLAAAHIKANHAISYVDAFVVAAAQELQATVITGDPEFTRVEHLIHIEWLPKK